MRDQVGFQMSAGIGVGISRGGGLIDSAMGDLVSRATSPIALNASGSASMTGAGYALAGAGPIDISDPSLAALAGLVINGADQIAGANIANDMWSSSMARQARGRAW
jgi:hypothetical protein